MKAIANKVFISQSNISSQFYNTLGMRFKTYVDTLKLSVSIGPLLDGELTISEISDAYGFSSSASYSKNLNIILDIHLKNIDNLQNQIKSLIL